MKKLIKYLLVASVLALSSCADFSVSNDVSKNVSVDLASSSLVSSSSSVTSSPQSSTSISNYSQNNSGYNGPNNVNFTILSLNDLHGAVVDKMDVIGGYIESIDSSVNRQVIKIANGDMFQGTAISNYSQGRLVVDILNELEFDEFTIGNHEFDWGIDVVSRFSDGNLNNGEANFPFLGANIYEKSTNKLASFAKEYVIVEKQGIKVGIIGVIGQGLENSILASRVAAYEFKEPSAIVGSIAKKLREEKGVNIVIAANHNGSTSMSLAENSKMAALAGSSRVDAIINGHSHYAYADTITSGDRTIPVIQSGSSGSYIGQIEFTYDYAANKLKNISVENHSVNSLSTYSTSIATIINAEVELTAPVFSRVIGTLGESVSTDSLALWGANVSKAATGMQVGMMNKGGIRSTSFYNGQAIKVEDLTKINPFDNEVKTVLMTGKQIVNVCLKYGDLATSSNMSCSASTINGAAIINEQKYTVAAIDYIFDKTNLDFLKGENISFTGFVLRDLMIEDIEATTAAGKSWKPSQAVYISQKS